MKHTISEINHMPVKKLKQLNRDTDSWKRSIAFMTEENIHLKNRLTEVLRDGFNETLLEEMEDYQNCFIKQDEITDELKKAVSATDDLLTREIFEDGSIIHEIDSKAKKLRIAMNKAEDEFTMLKQRFSHYLAENI